MTQETLDEQILRLEKDRDAFVERADPTNNHDTKRLQQMEHTIQHLRELRKQEKQRNEVSDTAL